jgi:hypothetical protein
MRTQISTVCRKTAIAGGKGLKITKFILLMLLDSGLVDSCSQVRADSRPGSGYSAQIPQTRRGEDYRQSRHHHAERGRGE